MCGLACSATAATTAQKKQQRLDFWRGLSSEFLLSSITAAAVARLHSRTHTKVEKSSAEKNRSDCSSSGSNSRSRAMRQKFDSAAGLAEGMWRLLTTTKRFPAPARLVALLLAFCCCCLLVCFSSTWRSSRSCLLILEYGENQFKRATAAATVHEAAFTAAREAETVSAAAVGGERKKNNKELSAAFLRANADISAVADLKKTATAARNYRAEASANNFTTTEVSSVKAVAVEGREEKGATTEEAAERTVVDSSTNLAADVEEFSLSAAEALRTVQVGKAASSPLDCASFASSVPAELASGFRLVLNNFRSPPPPNELLLHDFSNSKSAASPIVRRLADAASDEALTTVEPPTTGRAAQKRARRQKVEFSDFVEDDFAEVIQLLLNQKEYPVHYDIPTMHRFFSLPLFPQLSIVARERDTEAAPSHKKKVVGVVGTGAYGSVAAIVMLAVDTKSRGKGLGRQLLQKTLQRASMFTAESKVNPYPFINLQQAELHVWISQKVPLSLYLSTGFVPIKLIEDYYISQTVTGGYQMQLSLPYMPVTERLRSIAAVQEGVIKKLEGDLISAELSLPTDRAPLAYIVKDINALSEEQEEEVLAFLKAVFPEQIYSKGEIALASEQLRQFFFVALRRIGQVVGVAFFSVLPEKNVMRGPHIAVDKHADYDIAYYSLLDTLLSAVSRAASPQKNSNNSIQNSLYVGVDKVVQRMRAEDVKRLHVFWQAGFRLTGFHKTFPEGSARSIFASHYVQEMTLQLPWKKPEEFTLYLQVAYNGAHISALEKRLQQNKFSQEIPEYFVLQDKRHALLKELLSAQKTPAIPAAAAAVQASKEEEKRAEEGSRKPLLRGAPEGLSANSDFVAVEEKSGKKTTVRSFFSAVTDGWFGWYVLIFCLCISLLIALTIFGMYRRLRWCCCCHIFKSRRGIFPLVNFFASRSQNYRSTLEDDDEEDSTNNSSGLPQVVSKTATYTTTPTSTADISSIGEIATAATSAKTDSSRTRAAGSPTSSPAGGGGGNRPDSVLGALPTIITKHALLSTASAAVGINACSTNSQRANEQKRPHVRREGYSKVAVACVTEEYAEDD